VLRQVVAVAARATRVIRQAYTRTYVGTYGKFVYYYNNIRYYIAGRCQRDYDLTGEKLEAVGARRLELG